MNSILLRVGIAVGATLSPIICSAQTLVSGNISGTWSPTGNPYIATDNCTVPAGQTLTLQPGVVLMIGDGLSVNVKGTIQALGTASQRITIQAPVSSQSWSNIVLNYDAGITSRFRYCDFRNARTALQIGVYGGGVVMSVEILNCSFSNCTQQAIYCETQGRAGIHSGTTILWADDATLDLTVKNCSFSSVSSGCEFRVFGQHAQQGLPATHAFGYGHGKVSIINCVFQNITNGCLVLTTNTYPGASTALFLNNTIVHAGVGISAYDPWDVKAQSCIFADNSNAMRRFGANSGSIGYNAFYANRTNFAGYPSTYGTQIWPNRNGTMSDALYNIFQDPQFVSATDFHLQSTSPCIDAGTPDWNYSDMCFANGVSQGTSFPDLGAYGGPDAANWLDTVPLVPVQASLRRSTNRVFTVSWGAIPRSEYQVQWTTNMPGALSTNWFNVTNGWIRATQKYTAVNVATNPPAVERYYRVKSLGRTPGY